MHTYTSAHTGSEKKSVSVLARSDTEGLWVKATRHLEKLG